MVPPMASTNPLATDSPRPTPRRRVGVPESLEGREQFVGESPAHPGPLVDDVDQDAAAHPTRVDAHHAVGGVAQRVVHDVDQNPFQETGVGQHHGVTDVDLDAVRTRCVPGRHHDGAVHDLVEVDPSQFRFDHPGGQA